jgi:ABC-type transport system involved in cytochrome bd biosynthesis fused ATPase/permease subunit
MYIVVIAWLYVVVLMAVLEKSWVVSLVTIVLYGFLPLFILIYLNRAAIRRRRRTSNLANQEVREANRENPEGNQ